MAYRKAFLLALCCLPLLFVRAQGGAVRDWASMGLNGKVSNLKESVYLSHSFQVEDLHFVFAEKTSLTGFSEYRFDTSGRMAVCRLFQQTPYRDQYDSFVFDGAHRLRACYWGSGGVLQGREEYVYNIIGHLSNARQYDDTGGLFCETVYCYRDGLLAEEVTYNRVYTEISRVQYTYDSLKRRMKEESLWNPYKYNVAYTKLYTYDAQGHVARIQYAEKAGEKRWDYRRRNDDSGRILFESTLHLPDSVNKQRQYTYDRRHRVVKELSQDGRLKQEIRYRYDRDGRLQSIRNRFGDTDFRTFFVHYDTEGNWTEKVEYDGINLQVTTREITYLKP
ncbi:MAG: hypothetical protein J5873_07015 [Bacteroidales bacterium]|nr:hypothetical protein [Bacteroidales bacterium]